MNEEDALKDAVRDVSLLPKANLQETNLPKVADRLLSLSNAVKTNFPRSSDTAAIVDIITSIDPEDVTLVVQCAKLISELLAKQELKNLSEAQVNCLLHWLQRCVLYSNVVECSSLTAIGNLLNTYPQHTGFLWEKLFLPKYTGLLRHFEVGSDSFSCRNDLALIIVQCLDVILTGSLQRQLTEEQLQTCDLVGNVLFRFHYGGAIRQLHGNTATNWLLSTFAVLNKVTVLHSAFARAHISGLLGLSKAYIHYGKLEDPLPTPQKVLSSQQSLYDSAEESELPNSSSHSRAGGGKISKTRKPRAVVKGVRQLDMVQSQSLSRDELSLLLPNSDVKTSDSEVSDGEPVYNRLTQERMRRSKIRLAAITLVGVTARAQERRVLYGYWHVLFPSGSEEAQDDLLHAAQYDSNTRCRCAALQIAAQLLLGSKDFLCQAESDDKQRASAFISFAQNLGLVVLATYDALTAILSRESSLPVLTQALKCLAVLIQATPFKRLERGFIAKFVRCVRPFIYHRDYAIQVSALMVMEFLVALAREIPEIAEALGLPLAVPTKSTDDNQLCPAAGELVEVETGEEYVESDDDSNNEAAIAMHAEFRQPIKYSTDSPWLLMRVLQNLDYEDAAGLMPTSVRIGSLQVLSATAVHFRLFSAHLERVAVTLQYVLQDSLHDVRLYGARCLDNIAYEISRHLADKNATTSEQKEICEQFWARMLPFIMEHFHGSPEQLPAFKVCLCDAFSNIGVVTFERLPYVVHMRILGFLSGISSDDSEEATVRAAAVRALAVFVVFPSLCGNLVFIENTAELALCLVKNSNLLVRVKALWSLGNISDALISNSASDDHEHISDDLLRRLVDTAADACSDNDKVRCNAVRTLGNLLRLLNLQQLMDSSCRALFQKAIGKLIDCIRSAGNAKVKWNSCYAIGNLLHNHAIFSAKEQHRDLDWHTTLYPALCHVILHNSNFKVRINAAAAIMNITERSYFGSYFELFWSTLLLALEQSCHLDNFHEYNHRDGLQERLCLTICQLVRLATSDDFPMLRKHLGQRLEIVRNTWMRVLNRMVPEKVAPLLACSVLLREQLKDDKRQLSTEQRNAIEYVIKALHAE